MGDQAVNALVAIALGSVLAVLLLIPTAAVQYRLDGRLGARDLAVLVSAAVYALAIWTYTLLPVPVDGTFRCQGAQLQLFGSIGAIRVPTGGPVALLREPAFLQVALNVALFVPLGFFLRVILERGVVVATLVGFALSLLVETTQRTGVWHLYSCAYRLFDVDDLLVNTVGALLGSLLSLLVVRRQRGRVVLPTRITLGRRLVGLTCDGLFIALSGIAAALVVRGVAYLRDVPVDRGLQAALQWGVPFAVEALLVLGLGRTVGELTVSLQTRARRPAWVLPGRLVKLATGVAPVFALALLDPWLGGPLVLAFAVVTVVAAWRSRDHRGLANALGGLDLEVAGLPRLRRAASPRPAAGDASAEP